MNIQQVEYVVAVSDHGSFGKASRACYVGQSTLSTMIAKLEEEMGLKIFDRKNKPATITKEGEIFIHQCRVILDEIKNLREVVHNIKGESTGTMTIGVIPTVAPYLIPLFIDRLIQEKPNIQFVISEMTTEQILQEIAERKLDLGILSTPVDYPDIIEHQLYNESFYLYDRSKIYQDPRINFQSIDCNRLWLMDEGHCLRNQVERICDLCNQASSVQNLEYKSGSIDTLIRFVKNTKGVTLLPFLSTLDLPSSEKKYLTPFQNPAPARTIGLVVHRNFSKEKILDHLKEYITDVVTPLLSKSNRDQWLIRPL